MNRLLFLVVSVIIAAAALAAHAEKPQGTHMRWSMGTPDEANPSGFVPLHLSPGGTLKGCDIARDADGTYHVTNCEFPGDKP